MSSLNANVKYFVNITVLDIEWPLQKYTNRSYNKQKIYNLYFLLPYLYLCERDKSPKLYSE